MKTGYELYYGLVGSERCIRDRDGKATRGKTYKIKEVTDIEAVSYTHLTLPKTYSV